MSGHQARPNPPPSQPLPSSSRSDVPTGSGSAGRPQGTAHGHHHPPSASRQGASTSPAKARPRSRERAKRGGEKRRRTRMQVTEWKYTTAPMNARDLARDDDFVRYIHPSIYMSSFFLPIFFNMGANPRFIFYFLFLLSLTSDHPTSLPPSHMLVECLGTIEPLSVHKMDASRRLPTWEPDLILSIVQKASLSGPNRWANSLIYLPFFPLAVRRPECSAPREHRTVCTSEIRRRHSSSTSECTTIYMEQDSASDQRIRNVKAFSLPFLRLPFLC